MKYSVYPLAILAVLSCYPKSENTSENQNFEVITKLPKKLKELSGMVVSTDPKTIWGIEDQGNKNAIYAFGENGKLLSETLVENTENTDWEDLIKDKENNIYIGDFGNNDNDRKNLKILKVDLKNPEQETTKVIQTTAFHYEGQTEFPPKKSHWLYDCEAFVEKDGYFYLFTKNRSKGFDGTFYVFQIPNKEGNFEAKKIATLQLEGGYNDAAITSASINSKNQIALLTHKNLYLVSDFFKTNFKNPQIKKLPFGHESQKEALVFINNNSVLIADEKDGKNTGNLYRFEF